LTPEQETFFGAQSFLIDVANGEAKNQCPNETEYDFAVAVDDIFSAYIGGLYSSSLYEIKGEIDIFEPLDAEFGFRGIAA
jgi:hypothetical protein